MKAGDHIRIMKLSGWEHAIDVGDRTLIRFVPGVGAKREHLFDVATEGARVEVVTHTERVFVPRQVVARAFSRFADAAYSAMFTTSESFANWCKTGKLLQRAHQETSETGSILKNGTRSLMARRPIVVAKAQQKSLPKKKRGVGSAKAKTRRAVNGKPSRVRAIKAVKSAQSKKSKSARFHSRAKKTGGTGARKALKMTPTRKKGKAVKKVRFAGKVLAKAKNLVKRAKRSTQIVKHGRAAKRVTRKR